MGSIISLILRYKNTLFTLAVLVVLFVLGKVLIVPVINNMFETKKTIALDEARLARLGEKENLLKELEKSHIGLEEQKLEAAIPSTINLPSVLATIQKVATQTDITLGDFSIAPKTQVVSVLPIENASELSSFHFKVTLNGSLDNMERFIETLGSVSPLIHVESLEFTQERATVVFSFFFQPKLTKQFATDEALFSLNDETKSAIDKILRLTPPVLQ